MYDDTASVLNDVWASFASKEARDAFAAKQISTTVASQIYLMRDARGWSQAQLAEKAGMAQTRISVMENPAYENFTLSTLRRLASAFDVALAVRFVSFSELAYWAANVTPDQLEPPSFRDDSLARVFRQEAIQLISIGQMCSGGNVNVGKAMISATNWLAQGIQFGVSPVWPTALSTSTVTLPPNTGALSNSMSPLVFLNDQTVANSVPFEGGRETAGSAFVDVDEGVAQPPMPHNTMQRIPVAAGAWR